MQLFNTKQRKQRANTTQSNNFGVSRKCFKLSTPDTTTTTIYISKYVQEKT